MSKDIKERITAEINRLLKFCNENDIKINQNEMAEAEQLLNGLVGEHIYYSLDEFLSKPTIIIHNQHKSKDKDKIIRVDIVNEDYYIYMYNKDGDIVYNLIADLPTTIDIIKKYIPEINR